VAEYGGDVVGRAAEVGAVRPVRVWCVAQGEGPGKAVRHGGSPAHGPADKGRPRRAGLVGPRCGDARRRLERQSQKQFRLVHFDRVLLENFQLNFPE
jgi:hypothetical protein